MSGYAEPCIFGEEREHTDETPMISFGHMYHGITIPMKRIRRRHKAE